MKTTILAGLVLASLAGNAQKNVVVKKGKIKLNDEEIATYDGKGGNAFRMGSLEVTIAGSDTPAIRFQEDVYYYQNPLFEDPANWFYKISFATGDTFYYKAAPVTKKFFGNTVVLHPRKTGNDIIEELFNDTTPALIVNKALHRENITRVIAVRGYGWSGLAAGIKAMEDSIAAVLANTPPRNTKAPVTVIDETPRKPIDEGKWYSIMQDNQVIGRGYRRSGNSTEIHLWKKAPQGYSIMGNNSGFVPVLFTSSFDLSNYNFSKKFSIIKVVGKGKFEFSSSSIDNVIYDLANAAVAAGML